MRYIACLTRLVLALLLSLSPVRWADARLCDRMVADPAAAHAPREGTSATARAGAIPDSSSNCCCDDGACRTGCSGCGHALLALNACLSFVAFLDREFGDTAFVHSFGLIARPPTPPPRRA